MSVIVSVLSSLYFNLFTLLVDLILNGSTKTAGNAMRPVFCVLVITNFIAACNTTQYFTIAIYDLRLRFYFCPTKVHRFW